ncbi:MAG: hypothetical protein EPN86_00890 [Nanoarchaeota archaeon]|nr:MAG: hypothetical protein EPN86_00890 [Nanoarchaeota archaeon]
MTRKVTKIEVAVFSWLVGEDVTLESVLRDAGYTRLDTPDGVKKKGINYMNPTDDGPVQVRMATGSYKTRAAARVGPLLEQYGFPSTPHEFFSIFTPNGEKPVPQKQYEALLRFIERTGYDVFAVDGHQDNPTLLFMAGPRL